MVVAWSMHPTYVFCFFTLTNCSTNYLPIEKSKFKFYGSLTELSKMALWKLNLLFELLHFFLKHIYLIWSTDFKVLLNRRFNDETIVVSYLTAYEKFIT